MHHAETQILLLLLVGSFVGIAALRFRLPYTLALVVAGIALGLFHLPQLHGLELSADLLFLVFLPALLFEAAFHLQWSKFKKNATKILTLAVPGVLVAASVTAVVSKYAVGYFEPGFGWMHALLFASVIAATDPISVLALFKELGVPKSLYVLVEGESLVNDGVAVVVFLIVAAVYGVEVTGHGHHAEPHGLAEIALFGIRTFVWMAGVGVGVGVACGALASALMRQFDDHLIEVTLTTLVAYGSFLLAEELGASGVLSTVTAGMITGSFGTAYGMSAHTRLAVEDFWEYMAFLANTFVFLLVGLELDVLDLFSNWQCVAVGFAAVLIGRASAVYPAGLLTGVSLPYSHVMVWGGLRGSLSMVLIIGLPADLPLRDLLVHLVFGVVACSLFLQALTIAPLLARLGLSHSLDEKTLAFESLRAKVIAAGHALHQLDELKEEGLVDPVTFERLDTWYRKQRGEAQDAAAKVVGEDEARLGTQRLLESARELMNVEREAIRHAASTGVVSEEAGQAALRELDERLFALREAAMHSPEDLEGELARIFPT